MHVNELVIIQSLSLFEVSTGELLKQALIEQKIPIPVRVVHAGNRYEFFEEIASVVAFARQHDGRWVPVIHFEIHGEREREGLILPSGEFVPWVEVADALRELNIIVRNSLIVVLGVCFGAFILTAAANSALKPTPFCVVYGPSRTVPSNGLPAGFRSFYTEIFRNGDFLTALHALRTLVPQHLGFDTPSLFRMALQRRGPDKSDSDLYRQFIMADRYPELADVFPFDPE